MSKQREDFEEAYAEICKPIVRRPYPRNQKGEYVYKEIHEAYLMWQQAQKVAVPDGFVLMPLEIDDFDHPIAKALEKGIVKDLSASVIYNAMIEAGAKE